MNVLDDLLFSQPKSALARGVAIAAVIALFAAGILHWVAFFDFGAMSFRGGSWPTEYAYYSVIQEAVRTWTVPYHIESGGREAQRFLATHETVASPQLLLLRYMSIGRFLVANTVLMYAIGFWGCLVIRRRYGLSLFSFAALSLLFHFNGYITAHLATGHTTWTGYFLMPFYCYYVLRLCDTNGNSARLDRRIALNLALALFVMNLQGSFRMYVWNVLFLGLVAAFNWKYFRSLAVAVVFSGLMSCFIVVADVITYLHGGHTFRTGYPTVGVLFRSFVAIEPIDVASPATLFHEVRWWEYDMFTGAIGLAAVIYLGIWLRLKPTRQAQGAEYRQLDWPMGVMTVFSLGAFYAPFATLLLPFLNSEGTPSRFLITPFLFLSIIACIRLNRLLGSSGAIATSLASVKWLSLAALIQTAFELATHSKTWAVRKWDAFSPGLEVVDITIAQRIDPLYQWTVQTSIAVSALSLIAWTYCYVGRGWPSQHSGEA